MSELAEIRRRVAELEASDSGQRRTEAALRDSEERFHKIFEHSNDAIFVIDPERDKILDANPGACKMLGYSRKELLALSVSAIHPDEMPRLQAFAQSVFEAGQGWTDELTCFTKSGSCLPSEISASMIDMDEGRCMIALVRDISKRKLAEEALRRREEQYRDLYENAPIAYLSVGIDGLIRRANQKAVHLSGYSLKDLTGKPVIELYADTGEGKEKAHRLIERFRSGEGIDGEELEMRRSDGRSVWISLTVRAVLDSDGQVVESRSMLVDITERVQVEQALTDEVKTKYNYEEIIGRSNAIQDVLKQVAPVAPTDATVLVHGETGTGKELVCRAIHHLSPRSAKPLVKLNCAAIPPGLVESELFGHEKGAFTGAISQKQGRFELAHGGTIFLDEIGDLPLEAQTKLLRVLEEQAFERVGGTRTIKIDTRVIAATHRDLEKMVKENEFRQDLFYRLNVFPVTLPPLRERVEDIPLLANYFVRRVCSRLGRPPCVLTDGAMKRLKDYSWPGNVRELENIIERSIILCGGRSIDQEHIQVEAGQQEDTERKIRPMSDVEKGHIIEALKAANGKVSGGGGAAELLGLKPTTLESRMKKLGIDRAQH